MIYLSGAIQAALPEDRVGFIFTPNMGNRIPAGVTWAADNGCYSQGTKFDLAVYLDWLRTRPHRENCLFATAPDVVGDAVATWERSAPVLPLIRALGYKAALVAQDGIEATVIEWDAFDALFIGGTTKWKLSGAVSDLVREAKRRGKWVHMGRVNSFRRLCAAALMGCDSADGTYVAFSPDVNGPRVKEWIKRVAAEPFLPLMSVTERSA